MCQTCWTLLGSVALLLAGQAPPAGVYRIGTGDGKPPEPMPPVKPERLHAIEWQDVEQGFPAHIFQTGISPDGKLFFGAGDAGPTGLIRVFEVITGKQVQALRPDGDVWFSTAVFVPGGKYLAAAYQREKDVYLWDLGTGKVVRKLTGHTDVGIGLAAAPDGKRLLSWGDDRTVRLWDVETGKELRKLEGHTARAGAIWSADGKRVLTYSADKTLGWWDAETGKQLHKLTGHTEGCNTAALSPDGKRAVSFSADGTTRLWDLETGKELSRLFGGSVKTGACGFIAGGGQVAAFCDDQRFRIWETVKSRLVLEIDLSDVGGDRWNITASPDGRLALVTQADGVVRVYELKSGKEIHRYQGCRNARAFSFTPDGQYAVAGSFRAGLYVFRLPGGNP